ncbi:ABC-2 family transporter protein [Metabacillus idriensis]|uniref:ABC transporter permease n=1 Tax=Metabacillus idriensis TaxID=324768 RepID=UPI0028134194|nr:ABC-2 family transporter protein [Metabacillus idriensis]MDR0137746.1 ABC-2 family transporter protein [Metabacillus idriensis]
MLKRYAKLYYIFAKNHIKVMMEYRVDFFIGVISVMLQQFASIFFVKVVFDHIEQINGWTFYEILFIYGIAAAGRSLHHIFFDNLWTLGWQYIRPGQMDRLLIRPINPLFHVCADRLQQDGLGQLAIGIIILAAAFPHLDLAFGMMDWVMLVVMIISSGLIYIAINLFFATFSFWMVDSLPVVYAVFNLSEFAKYPLTIYNKTIRVFLTWIIPYGFTAFYPAAWFLDRNGYTFVGAVSPLVGVGSIALAYIFWLYGLRAYTSTGT